MSVGREEGLFHAAIVGFHTLSGAHHCRAIAASRSLHADAPCLGKAHHAERGNVEAADRYLRPFVSPAAHDHLDSESDQG